MQCQNTAKPILEQSYRNAVEMVEQCWCNGNAMLAQSYNALKMLGQWREEQLSRVQSRELVSTTTLQILQSYPPILGFEENLGQYI